MPESISAKAPNLLQLRQWTTQHARSHERLDYWVGVICDAFLEMQCSSRAAGCFDGELTHLPLNSLALNKVQASTQDVFRTSTSIARSREHPFYLITQMQQSWSVSQGGKVLHLRPGDAALVDAAQPYELHFPHSVACLSVQMPRAWLGQWLQVLDVSHARPVYRDRGWGAVLSALCMQLGDDLLLARQQASAQVEEQFGSLLSAALEPVHGGAGRGQRDIHDRAVAWLRDRLDQPGLQVLELAQAMGVSVRTLHRAFAAAGESLAGRVRLLRMERAQNLLARRSLARLSVAEIGQRCGYADASHFGRDFFQATQQSPARWRRQRLLEPTFGS